MSLITTLTTPIETPTDAHITARIAAELADPTSDAARAVETIAAPRRLRNGISVISDSIAGSDGGGITTDNPSMGLGWFGRAILASGGKLHYVRHRGVGGVTTDSIETNQLPLVLADQSQIVCVGGGTNDVGSMTSLGTRDCMKRMWQSVLDAGKTCVAVNIPPKNGASAPGKLELESYNSWHRAEADRFGIPVIDLYSVLLDPAGTGDYLAANTTDGTHPNATGAILASTTARTVLEPLVGVSAPLWMPQRAGDGSNMHSNGVFVGDANTDGIADGWANGVADLTNIAYSLADVEGFIGKAQRATSTGAATHNLDSGLITPTPSVGDILQFVGKVKATSMTGGGKFKPALSFPRTTGGTLQVLPITAGNVQEDADWVWNMLVVAPANLTGMRISLEASSGTSVVDYGQVGVRNLTTLGLT